MAEAGDAYDQVGPAASRRITKDANGNIVGGLLRPQAKEGFGINANAPTASPEAPPACEFRCGDVVHPKASLIPYMTVESVSWNGHSKRVHTVWFDSTNKLHRDSFDPETLKHKA